MSDQEEENHSRLYYVIPDQVMSDENLCAAEKILYALFDGVAQRNGNVKYTISDSYLSKKMGAPKSKIRLWLKNLEDRGHLSINKLEVLNKNN